MKKFMSFAATVAAIFGLVSCGGSDSGSGPVFTWTGDAVSGGKIEILNGMNAAMTVSAEAGINALTINVTLPNASFAGAINSYITNSENKVTMDGKSKTCVLDLCNDSKAYGVLCGSSARGKNSVSISFNNLISALTSEKDMVASELSFSFALNCVDVDGKSANAGVTFHWTPAPSVIWTGNNSGAADLTGKSVKTSFAITAPAKIAGFQIKVETPSSEFADYLKAVGGTASGNGYVLDLLGSAKNTTIGFPEASAIVNKTSLTIDLKTLVNFLKDATDHAGNHTFTFTITDGYGKTSSFIAVYYANS